MDHIGAWFHWFVLALVVVILLGSGHGKPGGGRYAKRTIRPEGQSRHDRQGRGITSPGSRAAFASRPPWPLALRIGSGTSAVSSS